MMDAEMVKGSPAFRVVRFFCCAIVLCAVFFCFGCTGDDAAENSRHLEVTATAYTSHPGQTQGNPFIGAWGDRLEPGMKAVAVSRDLLKMGLGHGSLITIQGLSGQYKVLDKMNKRWTKRIDIYFGVDSEAARKFGRRQVGISWQASS